MNATAKQATEWAPKRDAKGRMLPGQGGRPKGTPNKATATLKECILEAARLAGNDIKKDGGIVAYLHKVAVEDPKTFMPLIGRVLPLDVTSSDGSMRPVVALYMPDNRRDAKVIDVHAEPAQALPEPVEVDHALVVRD